MKIKENYQHTIYACYVGYITQAIINNFVPLLFLTFQDTYGISLDKIALLVFFNFGVQLLVDFAAAHFVDKIGYRTSAVAAHVLAAAGLVCMSFLPDVLPNAYAGILLSVLLYAVGGGLLEVLVSPIVEACPTEGKEGAMSLLHSFYCWGHVAVVVLSTLFFTAFGIAAWRVLICLWALIPLANSFYFSAVPIRVLVEHGDGMTVGELVKNRLFWLLCLMMVCAGAAEQGMSQWASAFAESALGVSKTVGDLAGPCTFAVLMGCARLFYGKYSHKVPLMPFMAASCVLCIVSYLLAALSGHPVWGFVGCALCGLSVGILWPGSFSIAAKVMRRGGIALFALLALAGDLGCAGGPALVGLASHVLGGNLKLGLLAALCFPVLLIAGILRCSAKEKSLS